MALDIKEILTGKGGKWVEGEGPYANIVITSRIRFARNLKGMPFPHMLNKEAQKEVVRLVEKAVNSENFLAVVPDAILVRMEELSPVERQILVEKHLISPQHAQEGEGKAVVLGLDGALSIMVNEEDHLRLQYLSSGLVLDQILQGLNAIDDALESVLDYAFDENLGYLAACPTNVGTGMRASVMMHLPALALNNEVVRVLSLLSQIGFAVRGLYGEGSKSFGNLFQISNKITEGVKEEETVTNLTSAVRQVIDAELAARKMLKENNYLVLEDRVYRAFGVLSQARLMSTEEALELLSQLRLGIDLGIIEGVEGKKINQLLMEIQPNYLQYRYGRELSSLERDKLRAEIIRNKINE